MGEIRIVTSALSLARELWRFGEPELAERAFRLGPGEVLEIGRRIGALQQSGEDAIVWPDGPRNRAYLLGAVAALEGTPRPCARVRRLPERSLPPHLRATEAERWDAARQISSVMHDPPPG